MSDIRRAEGVVIRRSDYSETSLIVTLYTDLFGKVRVIAKGAKRNKSPFRGKLDLFMRSSLIFYHGRGDLHILKECGTVSAYGGIREDLGRIAAASYVAGIVDGLTVPEDRDRRLYALLIDALDAVRASRRAVPVAACFGLKLLARLGNFPQYESCVRCGESLDGGRFFDGRAFRCEGCSRDVRASISPGTMRIIDDVLSRGSSRLRGVAPSARQVEEIVAVCSAIYEAERGKSMRAKLSV